MENETKHGIFDLAVIFGTALILFGIITIIENNSIDLGIVFILLGADSNFLSILGKKIIG